MSYEAIARRYAQALLDIGVETNSLSRIVQEVSDFADSYAASLELRSVIDNPLVSEPDREALLSELARRLGLGDIVKNTIRLLARRRRIVIIPTVARELLKMSDEKQGLERALVTSAKPLSDSYVDRLQAELEKLTGKKIVVTRQIDPSLIAGVITRIGDLVIDGSLKTRLQELRGELLNVPQTAA